MIINLNEYPEEYLTQDDKVVRCRELGDGFRECFILEESDCFRDENGDILCEVVDDEDVGETGEMNNTVHDQEEFDKEEGYACQPIDDEDEMCFEEVDDEDEE